MYDGPTYFSFNRAPHWQKGQIDNLQYRDGALRLVQEETYVREREVRLASISGVDHIVTCAPGIGGIVYLLDRSATVWCYGYRTGQVRRMFTLPLGTFTEHLQMACVGDVLYIADSAGLTKLAAFTLPDGEPIGEWNDWNGTPLHPLAITGDERGHAYVLVPWEIVYEIDGSMSVEVDSYFGILQLHQGRIQSVLNLHERLTCPERTPAYEMHQRFLLAAQGGLIYLFDSHTQDVIAVMPMGQGEPDFLEEEHMLARAVETYGKAGRLTFFDGKLFVFNKITRTLTVLKREPRCKPNPDPKCGGAGYTGRWEMRLDSTVLETIWHKVLLIADIPSDTQLSITYDASDDPNAVPNYAPSRRIVNAADALLQHTKGRYLFIRVDWQGTARQTPAIQKLRVYYPRYSYLTHLPAVYRADPQSSDFLERFLALFGTLLENVEEEIFYISRYFDVESAPEPYLKWLGSWMGVDSDLPLTTERLRLFLMKAPQLYQLRGTKRGMEAMIEFFIGEKPQIIEPAQQDIVDLPPDLQEKIRAAGAANFYVLLKESVVPTAEKQAMVQKIIDEERPVFAIGRLVVVKGAFLCTGVPSPETLQVGVNTLLSEEQGWLLQDPDDSRGT